MDNHYRDYRLLLLPRRLMRLPLCSGKPERAPHIGGLTCPLCWRCSCTLIAACFMALLTARHSILLGSLCGLPALVDVGFARFGIYPGSNLRRVVTGLLLGMGAYLIGS
jgi:uncharacterized membrane protein